MFWRTQKGLVPIHQILGYAGVVELCSACGRGVEPTPNGRLMLTATVGANGKTYVFCTPCGKSIMGHVRADSARQRYAWVPIPGQP